MDNVKGDGFYLDKIVADLKFVIDHTKGMTQTEIDIPWAAIRGMRNRIVHNYGVVSMTVVYDTVINHIPKMYLMLVAIMEEG